MAYIDSLQKVNIQVRGETVECVAGSFKGVPFFFESTEFSGGGRNIQTNGIPFSNDHVNEDTGKNIAEYSFNIYFVGEDAENQKNDFLRVCNEEGAGELVHPYFGVFKVRCGPISLSYGIQQEYISGTVKFIPENDFELRNSEVSLSGKTRQKANELRKTVADKTSKSFKVAGKSKSILDKALAMSNKAVDAVYSARKSIQKAAAFARQVGSIKSNLQSIMLAPGDFAARLQNLIAMSGEILGIDVDPKDNVANGVELMTFTLDSVEVFDAQSEENRTAVESLVRMSGASMVAENAVDCEFSSVGEAEHYQGMIHDAFEAVIEKTQDVDLYLQTQALEAAALKYLRDNLSNIPYEVEVKLPATNNLLSLAYGVSGSLDEFESVLARNGYRDPLFVKPSDRLLVLSDD